MVFTTGNQLEQRRKESRLLCSWRALVPPLHSLVARAVKSKPTALYITKTKKETNSFGKEKDRKKKQSSTNGRAGEAICPMSTASCPPGLGAAHMHGQRWRQASGVIGYVRRQFFTRTRVSFALPSCSSWRTPKEDGSPAEVRPSKRWACSEQQRSWLQATSRPQLGGTGRVI